MAATAAEVIVESSANAGHRRLPRVLPRRSVQNFVAENLGRRGGLSGDSLEQTSAVVLTRERCLIEREKERERDRAPEKRRKGAWAQQMAKDVTPKAIASVAHLSAWLFETVYVGTREEEKHKHETHPHACRWKSRRRASATTTRNRRQRCRRLRPCRGRLRLRRLRSRREGRVFVGLLRGFCLGVSESCALLPHGGTDDSPSRDSASLAKSLVSGTSFSLSLKACARL